MAVFRRGEKPPRGQPDKRIWWYKFTWRGELIRESTKQSNKRVAEQMEAARKTELAKGEVGLRDRPPAPTLKQFAEERFVPFVQARFTEKPKTVVFYKDCVRVLCRCEDLAKCRIDEISAELVSSFVAEMQEDGKATASINRYLATLRRLLRWAEEIKAIDRFPLRLRLLPGENRRDRILSPAEEQRYLDAAGLVGFNILADYQKALQGIRATQRGQEPIKPADPFVLRDATTILADCGLRPDELFRLKWSEYRDGALHIAHGKTKNARRSIPVSPRVAALLEIRKETASGEWVFPAQTKSGHIGSSTFYKVHQKACTLAQVAHFPLYTFRHTCLTRWSAHLDPYTLGYLAGHSDFATTKRYVHPKGEHIREALEKARSVQGGHKTGHTNEAAAEGVSPTTAVIN